MESKIDSQEDSKTNAAVENGKNDGTTLTINENVDRDTDSSQPVEKNFELKTNENIELAQKEEENGTRKDSKLAESSKLSFSRGIPKRYVLLFLVFLGFVNIYGLRINLNVALVAMVNNRTSVRGGVTVKEPAEFHWNSKTQGMKN